MKSFKKNSKEKLVKCATEVARLHRVSKQSCTQIGRRRKFIPSREIEFHFLTAWCNGNPVGVRGQRGDKKVQGRQKMCRDRGSNSGLRN